MGNEYLVSYIIPVYNVEQYLERCIESLLKQTYANIELVLVDDGSTDTSGKICDKYAEKYLNIQAFHLQNGGASLARKYGLEKAKGDFVAFVDSDDTVDIRITELLMDALVSSGLQIAVCDVNKKMDSEIDRWDKIVDNKGTTAIMENSVLMERFFHYDFWGMYGKIYHKSVFQNLYFPQATINEDYVIMAQLFTKYQQVAYIAQPLYHYRLHPGGLSTLALNERKFEEVDNAGYVYQFVVQKANDYKDYALANYMGSCIKLLIAVYREGKVIQFNNYVNNIKHILRKNFIAAMVNAQLLWKLKILICMLLLCPNFACKILK